uniref:EF-hand domain-containing protein n=1 Tax=Meloidogyne hapla TaxID=6305 RepID=A0A1I8B242_MELHA
MDENSDEIITFDEFINFVSNIYGLNYKEKNILSNNIEMNTLFYNRDFNGDKVINLDEFLGILNKNNYKINKEPELTNTTTESELTTLMNYYK